MQESHYILATSTTLLSLCKYKSDFIRINLSKPIRKIYGRSVECSTVEEDFTNINKYIKEI